MTVEALEVNGQTARVKHTRPFDPTWIAYHTLIKVEGDQVRVGTPLACGTGLSILEIYSVVQLILGKPVIVKAEPIDTIIVLTATPLEWKTYELSV